MGDTADWLENDPESRRQMDIEEGLSAEESEEIQDIEDTQNA
jgi:hypothetical protein